MSWKHDPRPGVSDGLRVGPIQQLLLQLGWGACCGVPGADQLGLRTADILARWCVMRQVFVADRHTWKDVQYCQKGPFCQSLVVLASCPVLLGLGYDTSSRGLSISSCE
ncbi:hypothetical protein LY76DRAFT_267471 [Colletotrichum caudatum]|nr:hypothetical protein LY76DRAFT_267471 [Colletotrichum caudatum]